MPPTDVWAGWDWMVYVGNANDVTVHGYSPVPSGWVRVSPFTPNRLSGLGSSLPTPEAPESSTR